MATTGAMPGREGLEEMGPVDYIVIEWTAEQPTGEAVPLLIDLVDRGIIRILDVAFVVKGEDGSVAALDIGPDHEFAVFADASSGLIDDDDISEAASALEPGTSAALLIWENRWAAPVAVAIRRGGGQLVASGRIPIQALLAALDASEESTSTEE